MDTVNTGERLPYRRLQALETKRRIAGAARRLFAERGYAATSIEQVARTAGVATRTVYAVFGTKKAILAAICDEWLAESGVADLVSQILAEPDARRRFALIARLNRSQWEHGQDVVPLLEAAAAADAEVGQMLAGWKAQRAGMLRAALAPLADRFTSGVDADSAAAQVRALSSPDVYAELVRGAGWGPDRYEAWLGDLLAKVLVG